jgi:hypothetical protein
MRVEEATCRAIFEDVETSLKYKFAEVIRPITSFRFVRTQVLT